MSTATLTATRPATAPSRTARLVVLRVPVPVLDETSDAARCEDCAHLPGCDCAHFCTPRGI
jgi:hypothetical protein